MKPVTIHTDGGCDGNPGPGGWAAVLEHAGQRRELSGGDPATTNNRMELTAAIEALAALHAVPCDVTLWTDSQYLRDGVTRWLANWKRRGWRTLDRKPVKNVDLWRRLDALASQHRVTWRWLKGHAGHADNERCDVLAAAEIARLKRAHSPARLREFLAAFQARQREAEAATVGETLLPLG